MKYKLAVLSVGLINMTTGKTMYDWSIYENPEMHAFLTDRGYLLLGREDSLKIGDEVVLIGNDSQKRLGCNTDSKVIGIAACEKGVLLSMLKQNGYDYYPIRPFAKRTMTRKLKTSYSIKGIETI